MTTGYRSLFWEVKVSYSLLGVFYFFLWYFKRRIKSGELCNGGLFVRIMTEVFGLKSLHAGRAKFYRAMEFFENNGYLSRYYSKYRLGFRVEIHRNLPFLLKQIPEKPYDVDMTLDEYGLYVDIYFNCLSDRSFKLEGLPKRKGAIYEFLKGLIRKGVVAQSHRGCYALLKFQ